MVGIGEADLTKDLEDIMADAGYGDEQVCRLHGFVLVASSKNTTGFLMCSVIAQPMNIHTCKLRAGVGNNPGGPWHEGCAGVRVHAWSNTRVTQGADPEGARSSYSA